MMPPFAQEQYKVMWMLGNKCSSATLLTPKKSCNAVQFDPCQIRQFCSSAYAILYVFLLYYVCL